jgi:hypothetical protein
MNPKALERRSPETPEKHRSGSYPLQHSGKMLGSIEKSSEARSSREPKSRNSGEAPFGELTTS